MMKKIFIFFLLLLTFSLHAVEEGNYALLDNSSAILNNDEIDQLSDEETDSSSKEKENRYVVVSQKNSSPLMMTPAFRAEEGRNNLKKKPISTADFSAQQRRNTELRNSSLGISRSPNPISTSERKENTSSQPTLSIPSSSLFKILIYCPGCKQWHTATNISRKPLPQILFAKNLQTDYWHPIHREDEIAESSLLEKSLQQAANSSSLYQPTQKRNFQLLGDDEVLHHINAKTGAAEKSSFQDPINELPAFTHCASILLQTRFMMPDSVTHALLMRALEQEKNALTKIFHNNLSQGTAQRDAGKANEKTPLLSKNVVPTNYSSISTKN